MISTPDLLMSSGWIISSLGLVDGCCGVVSVDSRLGILKNFLILRPTFVALPYFFFSQAGRFPGNGSVDDSRTGSPLEVTVAADDGRSQLPPFPQCCDCSFSICSQYSAKSLRFVMVTSSGLNSSSENELLALW